MGTDGCWLAFPDRSFDVVVSNDAVRAYPLHSRPSSRENLCA